MKTLPINVVIEDLPVLVIGGDFEALEKVEKLLSYGADITVLAAELSDGLAALAAEGRIRHICERYTPEHLKGYRLVYAADQCEARRKQIRDDTRALGVMFNAVDMPDLCDFIMPAAIQGKHFTLSICSGGKAAGLSRQLREELEASLSQEDEILEVMDQIRTIFKRKYDTFGERRKRIRAILDELQAMERGEAP